MTINSNRSEKGMALVTALLLGLIGAALLFSLYYMSGNLTRMSGIGSRYATELEAAKGVAEYIMGTLMSPTRDLSCNGSICVANATTSCAPGSSSFIDIPADDLDLTNHQIRACYLFSLDDPDAIEQYSMHGFFISVQNNTSGERAELEIIYKIKD